MIFPTPPLRVVFWLLALLVTTAVRAQDVVLTELMAAGQSAIADEDGAFPDWIELHNRGEAPVNLSGWHLTDELAEPRKWSFPSEMVPAGGYLVVFASGKNRAPGAGVLHTSFAFKSGGEFVALTRPDGNIASSFAYPVQLPDISFDGVKFLVQPTPGAPNSAALAMSIAPFFSQPHGFQATPFFLTLNSPTAGAAIHYTLDGSEPSETSAVYATPLRIAKTTVVRAAAFAAGALPSPAATRTYLFIEDIVHQSRGGEAPSGWPRRWGANRVDYGMDPRITERAPYKKTIRADLQTIPSLSIVMDLSDLFDPTDGIYANPDRKGRDWERPMSLELIDPAGNEGFQVNAGLRIRGGASRDPSNPKHSFRVLFRKEYGAPELKYPLFGPGGAARTKLFDIRCEQLVAWHHFVDRDADFLRDIFGRDTQAALGHPHKRGDFHHLYINGQYWGLYQTDERVSAEYAAEYFGGNENDYDVVKFDVEASGGTGFIDGTFGAWRRLFDTGVRGYADNADYFGVEGRNPDGSRNKSLERLLDVDSVIDYMLAGLFLHADDSPPSFGTQNNWYSLRSRRGEFGFRFFAHDWEISMFDPNDNRVGLAPETSPFEGQSPEGVNPYHYWQALRLNAEFRLRVADKVQKYFFHGGPLTVEAASARWRERMDEIDRAVVGESARWGDARQEGIGVKAAHEVAADWRTAAVNPDPRPRPPGDGGPIVIDPPPGPPNPPPRPGHGSGKKPKPFTREEWFAAANGRVLQGYLQVRSEAMLQQLREGGLYPSLAAPDIIPHGGPLAVGELVTIGTSDEPGADATAVYFTVDGSDPRRIGGAVSESARLYAAPFELAKTTLVKARARRGAEWSALVEVEFLPGVDYRGLNLTELHYNPPASAGATGDDAEFLELRNTGLTPLNLDGLRFTSGIDFSFPAGTTIAPGAFFVLARNAGVFTEQHPGVTPDGIFTGKLGDDGEVLTLATASGAPILSVEYDDAMPWPVSADGLGFSVVPADGGKVDDGRTSRASTFLGGSPGSEDPPPANFPGVVVNEVLAYPVAGGAASIELRNAGGDPADVSGWWLSDEQSAPHKFRIPAGTVIPPHGFVVFTAAQFDTGAAAFDLSRLGDGAWLFSADSSGTLTGYAHGFEFGASLEGTSFGRHLNSEGAEQFPRQATLTLGAANSEPAANVVRITEIHYAPLGADAEFVEIESVVDGTLLLEGARLAGFGFTFPAGARMERGHALVVRGDPSEFRAAHNVPSGVQIFGPAPGTLQDNGERIEIQLPVAFENQVGFFVADAVRYNDRKPWPTRAAGFGDSLQRLPSAAYGDDAESWLSGSPSPGSANEVNAAPRIELASPHNGDVVLPPAKVVFTAEASDVDGSIAKVEFLANNLVVGEDTQAPFGFDWTPTAGLHDLSARATDNHGVTSESDFVTIDVDASENGTGFGLRGEYFANTDLVGEPVARDDATIRFDWAEIPPLPTLARDNYSVRWTGKLLARVSGEHTLLLNVAGGVRLFVNGELVIDQWEEAEGGAPSSLEAVATLVAGEPVDLRIEYAERDGFGAIELLWSEPGEFEQLPVSQNQLFLPEQDPSALGITSASELPPRRVGRAFRTQLHATNGTAPYAWTVSGVLPSGASQLPPGLELSASGILSGTPTVPGQYAFTVRVQDAAGAFAGRIFTLRVVDTSRPELRPRVTITEPEIGAKLGNKPVVLRGTATAARGLAELRYSVNFQAWHRFPPQAAWSVTLDKVRGLVPGTNDVRVLAVDRDGRESTAARIHFHRTVRGPLLVTIEGPGTVTPSFLGVTQRVFGDDYTIIAHPAPGFVLSEWRGAFTSERRLTFSMFEGLELTAVFVPNPFATAAGRYTGLLSSETIEHRTRGLLTLALTRSGAFTGNLQFAGRRHPLRGQLHVDGSFFTSIELRNGDFLSFSMQRRADTDDVEARVGLFSGEVFVESTGMATRSSFHADREPCPFAAVYALAFADPDDTGPLQPGTSTLRISASGQVRISGELGDGTPWMSGGWIRDDARVPLYEPLYDRSGALSGELLFMQPPVLGGSGSLLWVRPRDGKPPFPDGFTVTLAADAQGRENEPAVHKGVEFPAP